MGRGQARSALDCLPPRSPVNKEKTDEKTAAMAAKSATPCRTSPTIRPKAKTSAVGRTNWQKFCSIFDRALGFSKGCDELALKNPPPLLPISLIASWPAIGPMETVCLARLQRRHVNGAKTGFEASPTR